MKIYNNLWLAVLCFSLLAAGCGQEKEESAASGQDETDSDYIEQATFVDMDGNEVKVSDFEGKVVMVDFWETWCKPCLTSFPAMQEVLEDHSDDFVILAVTPGFTDTKEDAQSFIEENDYDFTYLMDENKVHQQMGVQGIPYKVYVDADGNFIKKSLGTTGSQEQQYEELAEIVEEYKNSDEE